MNAREYMSRLVICDAEIKRKKERLQNLRDMVESTTTRYDKERVQRTHEKNPFENIMVKIVDIQSEIDSDTDTLTELKAETAERLDELPDERYKKILWLKYAERQTFGYIAQTLCFSLRHTQRLHNSGLECLEKIINNE